MGLHARVNEQPVMGFEENGLFLQGLLVHMEEEVFTEPGGGVADVGDPFGGGAAVQGVVDEILLGDHVLGMQARGLDYPLG